MANQVRTVFHRIVASLQPIDDAERESIARVCNCLKALARKFMHINDTIIIYTYEGKAKSDNVEMSV